MNIKSHSIGGLSVEVHHKNIKNLHIGVYPPDGRIRVAAPLSLTLDAIKLAVLTKISWIKLKQAEFHTQERQTVRQYVSGETHYLWGRAMRLDVCTWDKRASKIAVSSNERIKMCISPLFSTAEREHVMKSWRRTQLRETAAPKVAQWSKTLGVSPAKWGIRSMRTMWGSCNPIKKIIWLNSDLVEKPIRALDYVILHELSHLISNRHDAKFRSILDREMPNWEEVRNELNAQPLSAWS